MSLNHDGWHGSALGNLVTSRVCPQLQGLWFNSELGLQVWLEFHMRSLYLCRFPPTSQKHAALWFVYAKFMF